MTVTHTIIHCYITNDIRFGGYILGFMDGTNYKWDDTVFATIRSDKSFTKIMSEILSEFIVSHISLSLLDQDNGNWTYLISNDIEKLPLVKSIINKYN